MHLSPRWKSVFTYLWKGWVRPLAISSAIVFPFKSVVADWNWVPTGSMKPTIFEGDLVLVDKLAYDLKVPFTLRRFGQWEHPTPGEIVVFFSPKDGIRMVKRIVAGPGDAIAMKDNVLWLNGKRMDYSITTDHPFTAEVYEDAHAVLAREQSAQTAHWVMAFPSRSALRSFPSVIVPEGKYFMMGDSRDNSFDSRFFGFVDRSLIVGRASHVLLSFDKNHGYIPRLKRWFSSLDGIARQ